MKPGNFQTGKAHAGHLDQTNALASFRDCFVIDNPDMIYLDGNSLGRLAKPTLSRLQTVIEKEWGHDLIRGWNKGWYSASTRVGEKIAQLAGAAPGQVVVCDSTTVNLFKLAMSALSLQTGRSRIVSDVFNFPSDLYVLQGCVQLLGNRHHLHLVPSEDNITIDPQAVCDAIDENTALVSLSHVAFKSGFMHDAAFITTQAHAKGALVLWDLCHSIGAVPVELDQWGVDFAVGCTYKYLNGGPGSPAFLYVADRLQHNAPSPIWGWFGQRAPFAFDLKYEPAKDIRRFLAGTPPVLSLLAMEAALDPLIRAGIPAIRRQSMELTSYLTFLIDTFLVPCGFRLGSPRSPDIRGSHVSIQHPAGFQISQAMIQEMNVLPDFREPDNIRLGIAPLYISFSDLWEAVQRIKHVMDQGRYMNFSKERGPVT